MGDRRTFMGRGVGFWVVVVLLAVSGATAGIGLTEGQATGGLLAIPSSSMAATLVPGDEVLEDRTSDVRRGDVVVFAGGAWAGGTGSGLFVRRVMGIGGDRVVCCDARSRVTVNGKALDESYLYPGDKPSDMAFSVTVPPGRLWVMGDHRSIAVDSRVYGEVDHGTVASHQVAGRLFAVISDSHWRWLDTPAAFRDTGLATPRTGHVFTPLIVMSIGLVGLWAFLAMVVVAIVLYLVSRQGRRVRLPAPR
jgi:signal peptidase I